MSGRASWVLSPTDGKTHQLAIEGSGGTALATQCGHSLPLDVLQYDRLPSPHLCRECFAAYLLPGPPVFARKAPAGCCLSDTPESTPDGQPVPPSSPRWARCPADQHLHLLTPNEAEAASIEGHGRAGCGRLIPRAGLTIDGASVTGGAGAAWRLDRNQTRRVMASGASHE